VSYLIGLGVEIAGVCLPSVLLSFAGCMGLFSIDTLARVRGVRLLLSAMTGAGLRKTSRPAIIAESQPALKFRVNRPRPRSQPARAGRACVLVVYFFSRQLGQL
jgi:hypothetical protein